MDASHHFAVRFPDLRQFPRELAENLHVHGLHLKSQKPIQLGDTIGLQFRFPDREDPLLATAVVAWVSGQVDTTGKRAMLARRIELDSRALDVLDALGGLPEVHADAAAPLPAMPEPAPAPAAPMPAVDEDAEIPDAAPAPKDDRRRKIAIGVSIALLVLILLWLFVLGGMRWIAIRFLPPPPAVAVPYAGSGALGVEPPIPYTPAPKAAPPSTAIGFEYFQRPAVNEFIVTFDRPPERIVTSRIDNPLVQTFYLERSRLDLEREQYFLPFDLVRTVTFEVSSGVLRIGFVAQNPHYLPEPAYEVRGRELVIRFVASD